MRSPKTVFIVPKEKAIDFYLKDDRGNVYYLFTGAYRASVNEFFGLGISWNNLKRGFKTRSKAVARVIEKIQRHAKYVIKYEAV